MDKPLKPAQFAEKKIVEAILDSTYRPGESLPAERVLAGMVGVTRPTLRETLQRLSKEGWITIRHGKPTKVNDYLKKGGLGILHSLAGHGRTLPTDMVSNLLEARAIIFPGIAQKAISCSPERILRVLELSRTLKDSPDEYARYDWELQMLMVNAANNPVFNMIFNDFAPLYEILGENYFKNKEVRLVSLAYYRDLTGAIEQNNTNVKKIVEKTMIQTRKIWLGLK
ncbi:MAG: fatty acid metabolism transcriptional regulator FadR [Deltaproteobacteria bacterium]|nr:fatty acid metabolism transcriptional regulator FadR [Deltaproteobacteria bacterium]